MYHFVADKEFLGLMKRDCSDTVNRLVQRINNDDFLRVRMEMVGSGAKNLITQNASEPVDLDYNLIIIEGIKGDINNGRRIKDYVKKIFDEVLSEKNMGASDDSTACLSTKYYYFKKCKNKTEFKIDVAIVYESYLGLNKLIHRKTGYLRNDSWTWELVPDTCKISDKVKKLKERGLWLEVREIYLSKKNMYLKRNDYFHPSFVCYIETINEIYNKQCRGLNYLTPYWSDTKFLFRFGEIYF